MPQDTYRITLSEVKVWNAVESHVNTLSNSSIFWDRIWVIIPSRMKWAVVSLRRNSDQKVLNQHFPLLHCVLYVIVLFMCFSLSKWLQLFWRWLFISKAQERCSPYGPLSIKMWSFHFCIWGWFPFMYVKILYWILFNEHLHADILLFQPKRQPYVIRICILTQLQY